MTSEEDNITGGNLRLDIDSLVDSPQQYIKSLDESGQLSKYFPAVVLTRGVRQSEIKHNEGDAFTHTLMTLAKIIEETPSDLEFGKIEEKKSIFWIAMALLYHDTGKKERNNGGREERIDHVAESVKHANEELVRFLPPEEVAIVSEMIAKHEVMLSSDISWRIHKLSKLMSLANSVKNGRLLLKFIECDGLGRKVMNGHEDLVEKNNRMLHRNIEIYKILLELSPEGQPFPVQKINKEVSQSIKKLITV